MPKENVEHEKSLQRCERRRRLPSSAHQKSDGFHVGLLGLEGTHDTPFEQDGDAKKAIEQYQSLLDDAGSVS